MKKQLNMYKCAGFIFVFDFPIKIVNKLAIRNTSVISCVRVLSRNGIYLLDDDFGAVARLAGQMAG